MLGGTFDPPHLGHLALARHALQELALDRVLLMPARRSPHKSAPADEGRLRAGARERLEMCRLLLPDEPRIGVGDLELRREGPSYTVDTLRELHVAHPNTSLTFVLGADVARALPTWREPRALLAFAELAVAVRTGTAAREVREALEPLLAKGPPCVRARAGGEGDTFGGGQEDTLRGDRVRFLSMPAMDISSSLVRERVNRGESVVGLVGAAVADYIEEHDLYRARLAGAPAR